MRRLVRLVVITSFALSMAGRVQADPERCRSSTAQQVIIYSHPSAINTTPLTCLVVVGLEDVFDPHVINPGSTQVSVTWTANATIGSPPLRFSLEGLGFTPDAEYQLFPTDTGLGFIWWMSEPIDIPAGALGMGAVTARVYQFDEEVGAEIEADRATYHTVI